MIKRGVYCSVKEEHATELHHGVPSDHSFYRHVCFYYPEKLVGTYNSGKNWFKLFVERKFQYAGEITKLDKEHIEFYIDDPYNNDRIHYAGSHVDDRLEVIARRTRTPDVIWFEGVFEYVEGTGEL